MYLGRRLSLLRNDVEKLAWVEQLCAQVLDLRNSAVEVFYGSKSKFEKLANMHVKKKVHMHYRKFEDWLRLHRTAFLTGDDPAPCDFHLWEQIDQHEELVRWLSESDRHCSKVAGQSIVASYPLLAAYYKRFRALPKLGPYFDSPMHALPINNRMACWGSTPIKPVIPLAPKLRFDTVAREWKITWDPTEPSSVVSAILAAADGVLFRLRLSLERIEGLKSVQRIVSGDELSSFKVIVALNAGSTFEVWQSSGYPPEQNFVSAAKEITGVHEVKATTYTLMSLV
jgi:hypothetical protein